ncbi:Major facilitator superfamily and Major facilitator superfamily domain, general substrate transporter-containing protein [Strongyloides ratti]|uniref:Major facilitator superfamily and Major facilitator superfamily domain, general substrate transporter-containing protein n=1 Tax=Strongyloides ratti TaxID=34506 RepID=A0A090MZB9_STRRB|nr:Major facilitator superfamily and Major facilitator superfamily domain, general substrate transporter-containing protein [Strongyloides ratti]CEF68664.1 Major facilitator superfamily and Major facilitator superfamily domain, general substrate transporter-containing protein [Strongyloides ratti]
MSALTKNEINKRRIFIFLLTLLFHSFEQWIRTLIPFLQWGLRPVPDVFTILTLNSIGGLATAIGTFLTAYFIETIGGKKTALICTLVIGFYQIIITQTSNFYVFGVYQILLIFNNMPTVLNVLMANMLGEYADLNEITHCITEQNIPYSAAMALGPYLAIQSLFIISPHITNSALACGILHLLLLIPIIFLMPSENTEKSKIFTSSNIKIYIELLQNKNVFITLALIALIYGPASCYDQILRFQLSTHMLISPNSMCLLAFVVGLSTLITSLLILPYLHSKFGPQNIVVFGAGILCCSYLYLSQVSEFNHFLLGCPLQAIGSTITIGCLTATLMASVPKIYFAKAAALNRIIQITSMSLTPILTGYYVERSEISLICYVATALTLLSIPIVYKFGNFMKIHIMNLPTLLRND